MENGTAQNKNSFIDLASFDCIHSSGAMNKSSVIKSSSVKHGGVQTIEIIEGETSEPSIHIQREGNRIESIDFVCTCGKTAHVSLEYEEE